MLTNHNTDGLMDRMSKSLLDRYEVNYGDNLLSSIIAGFHAAYGFKEEGLSIYMEVINKIRDNTENLQDRNLLVWNLYNLSEELINEGNYELALSFLERAEKNWSRDLILGDRIGVYHVSWIEQLWLKRAKIYFMRGEGEAFEKITNRILFSRYNFFEKLMNKTQGKITGDKCTYKCYEILAAECKKRDIKLGIEFIKQAILHRFEKLDHRYFLLWRIGETIPQEERLFNIFSRFYYRLPDLSYDNLEYGYCISCSEFDGKQCRRLGIATNPWMACSNYDK